MIFIQRSRVLRTPFTVLLLILFLAVVGTLDLFASAQSEEVTEESFITVTDMRGRSVRLPQKVESLIALEAGSLRLVSYLDATEKVIAVEDAGHGREKSDYGFFQLATYRLAQPGLRDLPSIGSSENVEGLISADPDLIISSQRDIGQLNHLQETLGIPVFAVDVDLELYDTDLFYRQLEILGSILDRSERADELVTGIKDALEDIAMRSQKVSEPSRAYAGGMMYYGPADLLRTTGDYLPFDLTGTRNVMPTNPTGNRQPYMTSLEDLIASAPEAVFIDAANVNLSRSGFSDNRDVLEELVPAFSEREVYTTFVYKYYGTNWENQLINVYAVGKILYPEVFADISIEGKAEEIWDLFFTADTDLDHDTVVKTQGAGVKRVDWFE
ncbi:MAG: ABC transporter substrate-binding protein [Sphaerochaetaceae bacterium]|nr:ABC transporter substrate-binding protein [Sphaerochaetaceae bacterium]